MKITVLSKPDFNRLMEMNDIDDNNVELINDAFFISINDTYHDSYYNNHHFKNDHPNVKVMFFDDVEDDGIDCVAFSKEMASSLIEYISDNINKKQCIVHCEAGVSRSAAVGLFINDMMLQPKSDFMRKNPRSCPNGKVMRLLNNTIREKYE